MTNTNYTYEQFIQLNKELGENNLFHSLTNGRKLRDNVNSQAYQKKVLSGYGKIMNFIHKAVLAQTKLIK